MNKMSERARRGHAWVLRHIKGSARSALPDWLVLCLQYLRRHGRLPNLVQPSGFTEKVLWRAAFDRRPLLARISDKATARDYIVAALGPGAMPAIYYSGAPAALPFDQLPDSFVVKPTHGSGWVAVVRDKSTLDRPALIAQCEGWLGQDYHQLSREWIYKQATRRVHVEELIDDGHDPSFDYKLFVFHGRVAMIQVDADRFSGHRQAFYSAAWQRIELRMAGRPAIVQPVPRPAHLNEMVAAAERLGRDFDFVRVDCLCSPRGFYVIELTATPSRGLDRFEPRSVDRELGANWQLNRRSGAG